VGCWRNELGELSEVLGGGGKQELGPSATWPTQSQASHSEDAFEVSEQHFDALAFMS
jgi:hypothetical protein